MMIKNLINFIKRHLFNRYISINDLTYTNGVTPFY